MQILNTLTQYDTRMFLWCVNSRHQNMLAKTARQVSRSGDGYLQVLIPVGLALVAGEAGQHLLLATLLAFAFELPLYWILKNSFKRRRPPEAIPLADTITQG